MLSIYIKGARLFQDMLLFLPSIFPLKPFIVPSILINHYFVCLDAKSLLLIMYS